MSDNFTVWSFVEDDRIPGGFITSVPVGIDLNAAAEEHAKDIMFYADLNAPAEPRLKACRFCELEFQPGHKMADHTFNNHREELIAMGAILPAQLPWRV